MTFELTLTSEEISRLRALIRSEKRFGAIHVKSRISPYPTSGIHARIYRFTTTQEDAVLLLLLMSAE